MTSPRKRSSSDFRLEDGQLLTKRLGAAAPSSLHLVGPAEISRARKVAIFCSAPTRRSHPLRHTAKLGDRWAALEPIRQGIRHAFGRFGKDVARGLALRCDWGPQYIADAWINEVKWLGCTISPSYVGEPECNGVAERFMRTLMEQCIYLHQFESLEEARRLIGAFIARLYLVEEIVDTILVLPERNVEIHGLLGPSRIGPGVKESV